MATRKLTLPRHTNLAGQGLRISAFLIDAVIVVASSVLLLTTIISAIFGSSLNAVESSIDEERINSHLYYGEDVKKLDSNNTSEEIINGLAYFYINYLPGEGIDESISSKNKDKEVNYNGKTYTRKDFYTVDWFNKKILGITIDDPDSEEDCLYTFKRVNNEYDKSVPGKLKDGVDFSLGSPAYSFIADKIVDANTTFNNEEYLVSLYNKEGFIVQSELCISFLISGIVFYVVLPLFGEGKTIGKRILKLGLANSDGYKVSNVNILLRFVPYLLTCVSLLLPIYRDSIIPLLVLLTILLSSFGFAMASPKNQSLHDLLARTIVVDNKTSIIFLDQVDEAKYIEREEQDGAGNIHD